MKSHRTLLVVLFSMIALVACIENISTPSIEVTGTPELQSTATQTLGAYTSIATSTTTTTPSQTPTLAPNAWMEMPVIPSAVSERTKAIYQHGQELGNNPNAFSKVGDCDSTPTWFLGDFDLGPQYYSLGQYDYLLPVINTYQGSFSRTSIAVQRGFNTASVLTTIWSDPKQCENDEAPLACEVRLQQPSFAFITLGTNDIYRQDKFENEMRLILDYLIEHGVIPILATKADNLEGDHAINATITRLAYEYDLPLWNFWLAVQPLPDHGLQDDDAHLTWASNHFEDPIRMQAAWPWRNLTALQVLDLVWREVTINP